MAFKKNDKKALKALKAHLEESRAMANNVEAIEPAAKEKYPFGFDKHFEGLISEVDAMAKAGRIFDRSEVSPELRREITNIDKLSRIASEQYLELLNKSRKNPKDNVIKNALKSVSAVSSRAAALYSTIQASQFGHYHIFTPELTGEQKKYLETVMGTLRGKKNDVANEIGRIIRLGHVPEEISKALLQEIVSAIKHHTKTASEIASEYEKWKAHEVEERVEAHLLPVVHIQDIFDMHLPNKHRKSRDPPKGGHPPKHPRRF